MPQATTKPASVLLVGGGGREHALAWKLAQSPQVARIVAAPGNPGIAGVPKTTCLPISAEAVAELTAFAVSERIDLVVCGPESALVAGLGDAMRAAGIAFFGPSRAAAEIEGSKAYAKRLMAGAGVPTAAFGVFDDVAAAETFIDQQRGAVVVKADGLCAGKGVVVTSNAAEAKAAVRLLMADRAFGEAGARVVIEERLSGREVSMMALCDGERLQLLASSEDHKAVGDGDVGPNTGGMGTYSPSPLVSDAQAARIVETIFLPTVRALAADGRRFVGLLYGGLMLTPDRGPMVIEWNCRFGDPETQSVLMRLDDDLYPWLLGAANERLPAGALRWRPSAAVCVVLAAAGYPGKVRGGDVIEGLPLPGDDVVAFHAGTRRDGPGDATVGGRLLTAGGRVLGVTGHGGDLTTARARVYQAIKQIHFSGMHFRTDIGMRGNP
ncbi:MAG TPA: phosphoribosylamine--glycine ligase [Polyangia bacterium]|jgi:phosphoribosylamine--glycine ligase